MLSCSSDQAARRSEQCASAGPPLVERTAAVGEDLRAWGAAGHLSHAEPSACEHGFVLIGAAIRPVARMSGVRVITPPIVDIPKD